MRSICLTIQSTEVTEQAARITFQAPASWSWRKSDNSIFRHNILDNCGIGINYHFYFLLLFAASLHHETGKKAVPRRSQRARNYYLNLEENFQKPDEGIKFLSAPQEIALGGDGRGMRFLQQAALLLVSSRSWSWGWQDSHPLPLLQKQPSPFGRTINTHPCR